MKTRKYFECLALPLLLMLLAACSSSSSTGTAQPPPPGTDKPALGQIDTRCRSNADCAVKNVGNCCGTMPACVNRDSPTDPQAVQAQCQAKGMMGLCGFREISACQCDNGQCVEAPAANGLRNAPLPTGLPH